MLGLIAENTFFIQNFYNHAHSFRNHPMWQYLYLIQNNYAKHTVNTEAKCKFNLIFLSFSHLKAASDLMAIIYKS